MFDVFQFCHVSYPVLASLGAHLCVYLCLYLSALSYTWLRVYRIPYSVFRVPRLVFWCFVALALLAKPALGAHFMFILFVVCLYFYSHFKAIFNGLLPQWVRETHSDRGNLFYFAFCFWFWLLFLFLLCFALFWVYIYIYNFYFLALCF